MSYDLYIICQTEHYVNGLYKVLRPVVTELHHQNVYFQSIWTFRAVSFRFWDNRCWTMGFQSNGKFFEQLQFLE